MGDSVLILQTVFLETMVQAWAGGLFPETIAETCLGCGVHIVIAL